MSDPVSDIAFTPAVKARQSQNGSRDMLTKRDWAQAITDDLAAFIAERTSFYMATVSETGHPYVQHRGGPKGFLQVVDDRTLGFADFAGNQHYISTGNLDSSDKVHLFLMDYANQQRIKIWGRARVIEDDPELIQRLFVPGYKARPERALLISIDAWDVNCPQHIPGLYSEDIVRKVTQKLSKRIVELEAENAELRQWMGK